MARKANYYKLNSERCGFPNVPRSWFSEVILAVSVSFVLAAHRDTSFQLQWSWRQLSQVKHLCQVFFLFFLFILDPVVKRPGEVRDCDRNPQGPNCLCPSRTLLTSTLFPSDSSSERTEERGTWHQLTCHLPSHAITLTTAKMNIFPKDGARSGGIDE